MYARYFAVNKMRHPAAVEIYWRCWELLSTGSSYLRPQLSVNLIMNPAPIPVLSQDPHLHANREVDPWVPSDNTTFHRQGGYVSIGFFVMIPLTLDLSQVEQLLRTHLRTLKSRLDAKN